MIHQDDPCCFSIVKLQLNIQKFSEGWKKLWVCDEVRLLFKGNVELVQNNQMDIKIDNYSNSEQLYLVVARSPSCQYYSKFSKLDETATVI